MRQPGPSIVIFVALAGLSFGLPSPDDYKDLMSRHLVLPIRGLHARDIQDTFNQKRQAA